MLLYLIRHAESTFNRFASQEKDCPLTPEGIRQCHYLSGAFTPIYVDAVVLSPLLRAQQTYRFTTSLHRHTSCVTSLLCREQVTDTCDVMEGEAFVEESDTVCAERTRQFVQWLSQTFAPTSCIAVITHADFIHHLTSEWVDNASYTELQL
jgi:broad specificity phosphatase PhoE